MSAAGGSPALWQSLADAAAARGEIPWKSMDIPPRPPMLPLFGKVRAWMMTPDDIVKERPGPPPSTSSALMARELAEVRQSVDHLNARPARHRLQVGRRRQHAHAAGPLELHCGAVYPRRQVQRGAGRTGVRAGRYGPARRRRGMLGREILLLQSASLAPGSRPQVAHWLFRTSRRTPRGTRRSRRRPPRCCPTSFQAARPTSRRRRKKPRYPGCMAAFTIGPTSKWARTTASGSATTR